MGCAEAIGAMLSLLVSALFFVVVSSVVLLFGVAVWCGCRASAAAVVMMGLTCCGAGRVRCCVELCDRSDALADGMGGYLVGEAVLVWFHCHSG